MAFTSHADAAFDVCFENYLVATRKAPRLFQYAAPDRTLLTETVH